MTHALTTRRAEALAPAAASADDTARVAAAEARTSERPASPAASVAVIFVWVYYSAQIFLFSAEFTWVYAQRFGSRCDHADPTVEDARMAPPIPERSVAGRRV